MRITIETEGMDIRPTSSESGAAGDAASELTPPSSGLGVTRATLGAIDAGAPQGAAPSPAAPRAMLSSGDPATAPTSEFTDAGAAPGTSPEPPPTVITQEEE